jgi:hypothetical protein
LYIKKPLGKHFARFLLFVSVQHIASDDVVRLRTERRCKEPRASFSALEDEKTNCLTETSKPSPNTSKAKGNGEYAELLISRHQVRSVDFLDRFSPFTPLAFHIPRLSHPSPFTHLAFSTMTINNS